MARACVGSSQVLRAQRSMATRFMATRTRACCGLNYMAIVAVTRWPVQ